VEVIRVVNVYVKLAKDHLDEQLKVKLLKQAREVITQYKILTKEVLTQFYLLIVFLNPQEPPPSEGEGPCILHYLHAQNIVLNRNTIPDLISVLSNLKEQEYRCQLVAILFKAFQEHFKAYPDKNNIFDQVVPLFQVGRSVYGHLEEMIGMIIRDPKATWNLEGNYMRKYFVTTVALKNKVPSKVIVEQWPTIISDVISQAGSMIIPYATDCISSLFRRLY
jgi:hypothetical protein